MKALLACDANAAIGFGHLSRCLALAEALSVSDVHCSFAGQFDGDACAKLKAAGFGWMDLPEPVGLASIPDGADFVVIDSYGVDAAYLAQLRARGHTTVVIDDFCKLDEYPCDAILNFTVAASTYDYPDGPALILGPEHLLVRRRMVEARADSIGRDRTGRARSLLIAIGGSDPKQIAPRVLRLLSGIDTGITVRALAAGDADFADALEPFAPGSGIIPRQPDLSAPLLWADAAITGGGLIKYEAAFMGVPVAAIAQNAGQDGETKDFERAGLVFDLGLADSVSDEELSRRMSVFLSDASARSAMTVRARETFVPDPARHAAKAIIEAIQ